jgi:hypothetical protein
MDGQKTPVSPTVDTKQTRTPQKTRVPGMNPLSTFADPVASYLAAGDAWPNMPPAHRSLLLMQRTAGNRAVAQFLETGYSEPRATTTHEENLGERPDERKKEDNLNAPRPENNGTQVEQINGVGTIDKTRALASESSSKPPVRWGTTARPRLIAVSWAALQTMGALGPEFGAKVTGPPAGTDLGTIEGIGGAGTRGVTPFPTNYRAPNYNFNSTDKGTAGSPQWYASPTSAATAFEGDANAYYPTVAIHKVAHMEAGKNTYRDVTTTMSNLIKVGEREHCDDHAEAYKISLKEAEEVLTAKVYGKDFGPKPTKAEAEQMVLDTIRTNLTHAGLGEDKTKWAGKYSTLMRKTLDRDTSHWHDIGIANRRTNAAGDIIYKLATTADTKIGTVRSSAVITY